MNKDNEFDNIINRIAQNDLPLETPKSYNFSSVLGMLISISVISFFSGFVIMSLNSIINEAWTNLEIFRPGIGYMHSVRLFFFAWLLLAVFNGIRSMQKKS